MQQPLLKPDPDSEMYQLQADYTYSYNNGRTVTVLKDFMYNGASIPMAAWPFLYTPFHPKIMAAALIHDWLYSTGELDRFTADSIFYRVLIDSGVPDTEAEVMYRGVRIGGFLAYEGE